MILLPPSYRCIQPPDVRLDDPDGRVQLLQLLAILDIPHPAGEHRMKSLHLLIDPLVLVRPVHTFLVMLRKNAVFSVFQDGRTVPEEPAILDDRSFALWHMEMI